MHVDDLAADVRIAGSTHDSARELDAVTIGIDAVTVAISTR